MFNKKKQPPIKSLIAQGTRVEGHVHFEDGLRIDGEVTGDIRALGQGTSLLVVSELAKVTGGIHAGHVIINGTVLGPVVATELLELQPKARVEGDVSYLSLEMHQGATISGQLKPMAADAHDEKPALKLAANNG
jgi:cytoskeletal protein CcmA (bactofilin family)